MEAEREVPWWQKFNFEKVKRFFKEHEVVLVPSGIAILLVAVGLIFFLALARRDGSAPVSAAPGEVAGSKVYTVLPQEKRPTSNDVLDGEDFPNPFAGEITGSLVLRGVVCGGNGSNAAILDTGKVTYVVREGTVLGVWRVIEIKPDAVVLGSGERRVNVRFGGVANSSKETGGGGS